MIPEQPQNSYRITLELLSREPRLDSVLMRAMRAQGSKNLNLMNITRTQFKQLFKDKKILIKNQPACASSAISSGTTYVDILGFGA
jgi:hypothetical protein